MWIILLLMAIFLILDKTKVLQCNTLFMSVLYVVGIPLMLCGYFSIMAVGIMNVVTSFTLSSCVALAVNLMLAFPLVIMLIYILVKICRAPIDRGRFAGSDEQYAIACMKRQRTLLWIVFPLLWISTALAFGLGIKILITALGASLITFNPFFWIICLCTLGLAFAWYVIVVVGYMSATIIFFLLAAILAGIFTVITIALTVTALYRMRNYSGYSKLKNVLLAVSMLIPVWSLFSMIEISSEMKRAGEQGGRTFV